MRKLILKKIKRLYAQKYDCAFNNKHKKYAGIGPESTYARPNQWIELKCVKPILRKSGVCAG
jgi:hypothetical protein